ncbi:MAG: histidinol dehydrogenase, partial [Synergistaceae bacterium]|nr:histidinol dehydrogenase [Synergistaceae bacterium]
MRLLTNAGKGGTIPLLSGCSAAWLAHLHGVQAIGAMAYGTESVPKVYKIFGPGNQYVTAAKQTVGLKE